MPILSALSNLKANTSTKVNGRPMSETVEASNNGKMVLFTKDIGIKTWLMVTVDSSMLMVMSI